MIVKLQKLYWPTRFGLNLMMLGLWAYLMAVAVGILSCTDMGWVGKLPIVYETLMVLAGIMYAMGL